MCTSVCVCMRMQIYATGVRVLIEIPQNRDRDVVNYVEDKKQMHCLCSTEATIKAINLVRTEQLDHIHANSLHRSIS